jgi:hypothetical protein
MTGTGTQHDPFVAMSADPAQIRRDVRASLAHFGRTDDDYYVDKASTPAEMSNHTYSLGHNRYWESSMEPTDTGSRNPLDCQRPALYLAVPGDAPPAPPTTQPAPTDPSAILTRLDTLDADMKALTLKVATAEALLEKGYVGTVKAPWPIGTASVTLLPKKD